jgi:hypothetical protein
MQATVGIERVVQRSPAVFKTAHNMHTVCLQQHAHFDIQ